MTPAFRLLCLAALLAVPRVTSAQLTVTSSPLLERSTTAGEQYEGRIELTNSTAVPQEARLYQTEYTVGADGRTSYGQPGSQPRSNAAWVTLSAASVLVPAGGRATVTYVVKVPNLPSLRGTYWSMVMVEGVDPAVAQPAAAQPAARPSIAVRTRLRYGVQLATHIGADTPIRIAFDSVKASSGSNAERILSYDFANPGERAARLLMTVELFGADGAVVRKLEQQRGLLYPGHSARQRFDFGPLPAGTYTAMVTADAGGDQMFGAQYTLHY